MSIRYKYKSLHVCQHMKDTVPADLSVEALLKSSLTDISGVIFDQVSIATLIAFHHHFSSIRIICYIFALWPKTLHPFAQLDSQPCSVT